MLLQTNSYIVPQDKRAEHARLLRRFRQVLARLGCDQFEVYEQVGSNWNTAEISGRVVQIMRFRDRRHQLAVQAAERNDPVAQAVIAEFCNLINFPYQQQQGLFAVGFYNAVLPTARGHSAHDAQAAADAKGAAAGVTSGAPEQEVAAPLAESPIDQASAEPDVAAAEIARQEQPAEATEVHAPSLDGEEPLFAEGTEGIIAAAENLSDEQLDAGGDAAVASAVAGPSEAPSAPSSNGAAEHPTEPADPDLTEAGQSQAQQPHDVGDDHPQHGDGGADFDLSALLDPHLGPDNGHANPRENGGNGREWGDDLSLDRVLDDEMHNDDEPLPVKDAALEGESEHDRNHVSQ